VELSWPTDLCFCSVCSSNADSESGFFLGATVPLQCLWRDSVTLISTLLLTGHGMVQQLYGMLGCKSPVCNIYVALPFDDCYHPIVLTDLMYQKDWSGFCIMLCTGSRTGSVHIPYTTYSLWGPCFLFSCVVCLKQMSQVWLAIALTHIHQFLQFLVHVISRDSKIGCSTTFSNTSLLLTL